MDWRTGILEALDEFRHHRLRTFLTLLGMIFGVGAVVSMLAVGEGARREALRAIETLGLRTIRVEAVPQPEDRLREIRKDSIGLNLHDLAVALEVLPRATGSAAAKRISVYSLHGEGGDSEAEVLGVTPGWFPMGHLRAARGRLLDEEDERRRRAVAVLGSRAARELFGDVDPLGRPVRVNHQWFRVVGLLADRELGKQEFEGVPLESPSHRVYVPLATAREVFRFQPLEEEIDVFRVEIGGDGPVRPAARALARLLRQRHRDVPDWRLVLPEELLARHRRTRRIFDVVMAAIAGISLLVGGIGIMNIMLANVLERTPEIGIRRAVGARRSDILGQFLVEALGISLAGGVLGIALGFLLAWGISAWSGWPLAWSWAAPVAAVLVCTLVGVVFGLYPAVRAARLDPIEALRRN